MCLPLDILIVKLRKGQVGFYDNYNIINAVLFAGNEIESICHQSELLSIMNQARMGQHGNSLLYLQVRIILAVYVGIW